MTDKRCKQIMEQLGMSNSKSLYMALYQVANETEQEVRKKLTSDNSDYAKSCDFCDDKSEAELNICQPCLDRLISQGIDFA